MAGDWIKMREDLHEDPAVLWMSQELGVRPETIVGFCHRFWGLMSRQTGDGCLVGPTLLSLGNVLGLPGFPELLVRAGWLEHENDGEKPITRIPNFERHLSEGAKARLLALEKKRKQRLRVAADLSPKKVDKCPAKTGTREEKRREEKKNTPLPPLPSDLDCDEFRAAWNDWVRHRSEIRKPMKPTQAESMLKQMAFWGVSRSVSAIRHTITMGWTGIREPESNGHTGTNGTRRPVIHSADVAKELAKDWRP